MNKYYAYGLSLLAALLAFIAWGQGLRWHFAHLSTYRLFPVFGLLAFSLMWSMYMVSLARRRLRIKKDNFSGYYNNISFAVLVAIVLHPGLLVWQLWRDGFGLPPQSYLRHYVAPGLRWAAVFGSVSFLIFLSYELRYRYRQEDWWRYMEYLADVAMVAIFIHALKLGTQIQHGWFKIVWFFYGVTLFIALTDLYWRKLHRRRQAV